MNRKVLAVLALAAMLALSGCTVFGSNEIDEDQLVGDTTYQWETNATATYNLSDSSSSYTAVIEVTNQSELAIHRRSPLRGDESVPVNSLKFRFENGTVVNATHTNLTATRESDQTLLGLPANNGSVAWTAPRDGKSWSVPKFVDGPHQIVLPDGTRVGVPLLSRATPPPDRSTVENNQMTLRWEDPGGPMLVRYYLLRDLYLFASLFAVAAVLGTGGTLYYLREIRQARKKREDVGLDVEYDDDEFDNDDPPPGLR